MMRVGSASAAEPNLSRRVEAKHMTLGRDSVPVATTLIRRTARLAGEPLCRLRRRLRFGYAEPVRFEIHVDTFLRAPILFAEFSGRSFSAGRRHKCRWMRSRLREHPNADDSGI